MIKVNLIEDISIGILTDDRDNSIKVSKIPVDHFKNMIKTANEIVSYIQDKRTMEHLKKFRVDIVYSKRMVLIVPNEIYIAIYSNPKNNQKDKEYSYFFIKKL